MKELILNEIYKYQGLDVELGSIEKDTVIISNPHYVQCDCDSITTCDCDYWIEVNRNEIS